MVRGPPVSEPPEGGLWDAEVFGGLFCVETCCVCWLHGDSQTRSGLRKTDPVYVKRMKLRWGQRTLNSSQMLSSFAPDHVSPRLTAPLHYGAEMAMTDELLTVEEAAAALGVAVPTVYNRRNLGEPPVAWRGGRRVVYRRSDLDAFLAREREASLR